MNYNLAAGWEWTKLGECCEVISGATPRRDTESYWGGDIPWVTPKELSSLERPFLHSTAESITQVGYDSCSTSLLPVGTVLFSSRAPIGLIAISGTPMCTNQGFKSMIPGPNVDSLYLYYCLRYFTPKIQGQGTGSTFKEVSKRIISAIEIPLPPLDEQRHIAALLDRADALRAKRRRAQAMLDKIEQSIFREMFGNPFHNPMGWPERTLKEASTVFSDGPFGSKLKSSHYVEDGVRVVRLQNIGVGEFVDEDQAFVSQDHFDSLGKHRCVPDDVLVGTLGDPNLRACILPSHIEQALNKADCVQIRPDPNVVTSGYLCWLLNMPGTVAKASLLAHGQTRSRISMGQLTKLELPMPPLDLQKAFDERLQSVAKLTNRVMVSHQRLDDLYHALAQRAFRGELTELEMAV